MINNQPKTRTSGTALVGPKKHLSKVAGIKKASKEEGDDAFVPKKGGKTQKVDSRLSSLSIGGFPSKHKSTCCGEVLLVSSGELLPVLEEKAGFKCDEVCLEDSAVRLLKQ